MHWRLGMVTSLMLAAVLGLSGCGGSDSTPPEEVDSTDLELNIDTGTRQDEAPGDGDANAGDGDANPGDGDTNAGESSENTGGGDEPGKSN